MRLYFPNKEREDVVVAAGNTAIGAAPDNGVVIERPGVAPHHVSLGVNERSLVLSVLDPQARTHVNSRPVREKALLRLGDIVSLDTVQFVLKPDRDDSIRTDVPESKNAKPAEVEASPTRARMIPPKVVLRGVSGAYFGKIIPVRGRLVIGRGSECDLILDEPEMSRRHAMIENSDDGIFLRDLGSANGTFVNGVQVRDAVLHPDDQIAFDRNRFLLEAPGMPARKDIPLPVPEHEDATITQTMQAVRVQKPAEAAAGTGEDRNRNDIWWLIGAAALIGAGIALLLFVKF
ncbi:MAG TPA: FHA domain-containing protein [Rudaea sp.]|nr:FHA domain-containing protein [Rudaea sp.]